jgi:putative ABC transport system ATP-binding protein
MLLKVGGLKHRIGGRVVLDAPDWRQAAGDHSLILGASGSGKTTLINIVAGLVTPSEGSVVVDGSPMSALPPVRRDALRRRTIALVFQTLRLIPALSVRQNMALAQRVARGVGDAAEVERLIAAVGLKHRADARPRELSQGEGQRAAIARALAVRPKLLIADEPTSALDDANASAMVDLLLAAADETGATLLIATHDGRIRNRFARTVELAPPQLKAAA